MQNLQNWGFNAVRLGVMWPGVSPSKGVFNQTYLNTMNQIVSDLGKYGIYSIVDCHQGTNQILQFKVDTFTKTFFLFVY
jgi:endoglycosylceramidase